MPKVYYPDIKEMLAILGPSFLNNNVTVFAFFELQNVNTNFNLWRLALVCHIGLQLCSFVYIFILLNLP